MKKQAFNPYLPSYEYVPDGEPRVFGDRIYIFGSHDAFEGAGYCPHDYVSWSAPVDDLGNWTYGGVTFPRTGEDAMNADGAKRLYAPDVVQGPDGRYYLYYVYNSSPVIGVAVCDTPMGPFKFYGYVTKPDGNLSGSAVGDMKSFDPGVLVDDDGRVYLYTGFAPGPGALRDRIALEQKRIDGAYCVELAADMITIVSDPVRVAPGVDAAVGTDFDGHAFFEASSPRKINGKYYFVYSSIRSQELCYAISDRPDGGYRYGGTIISIADLGYQGNTEALNYTGNTHGGLAKAGEQWYIFYHRQTNQQGCARQGCAEPVTIAPDGSIAQVEMTSCGLNGGILKGSGTYEARIACNLGCKYPAYAYVAPHEPDERHPYFTQSGTDREDNPDQYIKNMRDGAWCGFKYFDFRGQCHITAKVRGDAQGQLIVSTARNGEPVAILPITPAQDWGSVEAAMSQLTGKLPLYFRYEGTGAIDFNSFTLA